MKKILFLLVFFASMSVWAQNELTFNVTLVNTNVAYAPRHIIAIWVEDGSGSFVRTLYLRAANQAYMGHLQQWSGSTGRNSTDANTGATVTDFNPISTTWNFKDINGNTVADGDYTIHVEFTSANGAGPYTSYSFTKSPGEQTVTFEPDQHPNIINASLTVAPKVYPQLPGLLEAEDYDAQSGVQTEGTADPDGGNLNVGWIDANDYMDYEVNVNLPGTYLVEVRLATPNDNVSMELLSDNVSVGTLTVPVATGGWQAWQTHSFNVDLQAGMQTLRLQTATGGFNLNWLNFSSLSVVTEASFTHSASNMTVDFDASASSGTITNYAWNFGDGNSASGQTANHTYTVAGDYTVTLTVTDDQAATDDTSMVVSVPNNEPPVADAGEDQVLILPTASTTLDGSGSSDPDGNQLSYSWSQISGPTTATINNQNAGIASISDLYEGSYIFELEVFDGYLYDTDQVTIGVYLVPPTDTLLFDDFNRANNAVFGDPLIGTTWQETEAGGNVAEIMNNAAYFSSGDGANTPLLKNVLQSEVTNGILTWTFDINWAKTGNEGTYEVRMQMGQTTMQDNNNVTGIAVDLIWGGVNNGLSGDQYLGYVDNSGAVQSLTQVTSMQTITVIADVDAKLYDIEVGGVSLVTDVAFRNPDATIGVVRFLTNGVNAANFGGRSFDNVLVVKENNSQTPELTSIEITSQTTSIEVGGLVDFNAIAKDQFGNTMTGISINWSVNAGGTIDANGVFTAGTVAGIYTVTASSGTVNGTAQVTVNDPVVNIEPTANAGIDQYIQLPANSVTITGSGTDTDGTIASYSWVQTSKPAAAADATITNGNQAVATFLNLVEGTYTFQLTVTDNQGATGTDVVEVVVEPANQLPVASFTYSVTDLSIDLDASASSGTITNYAWDFGDGNSASGQTANHTFALAGDYTVTLTVTDNVAATDATSIVVSVLGTEPPIAFAGMDISISSPENSTTIQGSGFDPDGTIESYLWAQISGSSSSTLANENTAIVSVSDMVEGTYTFQLTVTDNQGATGTDVVEVVVLPENQIPVASFTSSVNNLVVHLDASASSDSDGSIVIYAWDLGDGNSASGQITSHTYAVDGDYTITLTVTDNQDATANTQQLISVSETGTWLNDASKENGIEIFPNPAKDIATISFKTLMGVKDIMVMDNLGKIVEVLSTNNNSVILNTNEYAIGVYFVNVSNGKEIITKRLIVE